jgi:23S rRNA G2069 N7-methylase RlmK/C1962 C5-methylase RlmI
LGYDDPQGAARLVFSERDGLSGLVVDRYGDYLAVQVTSLGMEARLPLLARLLVELAKPRGIVVRTERGITQAEGLGLRDGPCWGDVPDGPVVILENGLRWHIDLREGQKTGFYLHQRENRRAAAAHFRAYHWLNRTALGLLEPGGILVTCSCSGLVTREDFLDVLVGAAQHAHRHVQVLQQRGASPDHPVAVNCRESEYLKCFICRAV